MAEDGRSVPKYADAPFAFVWGGQDAAQPIYADRDRVPALPDEEPATRSQGTLLGRLAQAEQAVQAQPQQADGWQQLAELLHFELYWLDAAAALYEQALKLDPERHALRWRLIDLYLNTSDIDPLERQFAALRQAMPDDALLRHYDAWFQQNYVLPETR